MDYEVINNELFSLDIPCSIGLSKSINQWSLSDH